MMDHDEFCSGFAETLEGTADWRRRKAEEFPDDAARSLAAADDLELLAKQVSEGRVDPGLSAAYIKTVEDDENDWRRHDLTRSESENLRQVGFLSSYETPDDLLETMLTEAGINFQRSGPTVVGNG
ncbi:hypothetical protein [Amorphus orientalis]|uniref:Uncharacterized protein n=1 Tax=Amorphus orientalis TaxID=649198 RepID=A0AAE3VSG6_9HYPH|nr:hypothetical protein [Amorphus orientalis]MDQ0317348.1 hypothetical protein [Amorphus orientalis]